VGDGHKNIFKARARGFRHRQASPLFIPFHLGILIKGDGFLHRMDIYLEREKRRVMVRHTGTGAALLKKLCINPETVLIIRSDSVVPLKSKLSDNDSVRIIPVISGG